MKRTIHLIKFILLLLAASPLAAQQTPRGETPRSETSRTMFVTYDRAPLYDSASYLSSILTTLPRGESVSVTGRSGDYLHVIHGEHAGYVLASNLGATAPKRSASRRAAAQRQETASEPAPSHDDAPARTTAADTSSRPATASPATAGAPTLSPAANAQCRAITKSGKQCSRRTSDPSGFCWQHKK